MTEAYLLTQTLDRITENGTNDAYQFMISHLDEMDALSSQVYNFLYCLAATSDKREDALKWLEEAILKNALWYRPEVFEDEDLDPIRDDKRFKICVEKSNERYQTALTSAKTICSWTEKKGENLLLVLHGNQQNIKITETYWTPFTNAITQVEYLQSKELDSYDLFRWEDHGSGPNQLLDTLKDIRYQRTILGGFSAGCNVILRAIEELDITCDKVILQSPWIPMLDEKLDSIVSKLKSKGIEVLMICGIDDEDCLPRCKRLEAKAHEIGLKLEALFIPELGHDYPDNFLELVKASSTFLEN